MRDSPWVHSPNKTGRLRTGAAHCRDQSGSSSVSFSTAIPLTRTYRPFSRIASQRLPMRGSPRAQLPIRRVARIDVDEGDGFGGNGQGKST